MVETVLSVVLQHHNRLFREMLAAHLAREPDIAMFGTAASGPELIQLCDLRRPSIALFEADAPRWSNDRLVSLLLPPGRPMRMIGLHQSLTTGQVIRAYEAGVSALVPYSGGLEALLAAIRAPSSAIETARAKRGGGDALTQRELEVLYLVCAGYPPRQIGLELGISPHTVENHKQRIFAKLGVHNQAHAAASAVRLGLLSQAQPARLDGLAQERRPGLRVVLAKSDGPVADRAREVFDKHHIIVVDTQAVPKQRAEGDTKDDSAVTVLIDPQPTSWSAQPGRGVVAVTSEEPKQHLMAQAVASGVTVLPSSLMDRLLVPAVEAANAGYVLISSAYSRAVLGPPGGEWRRWQLALTPREQEILSAIAQGHTTKQTARLLGISVRTVENLQGNLFRKLRVHRKAAALVVAHELGLLEE
ncbi:response regulator transcription factor [Kibdelosporangium aridum]|uniref:DNA-binding response regulator, NarL/FixJ family, contains REC and HTH domains n=1 Tax=Kibdelosporangium aridum TaxID=2030 RepID=A0A1W2EGM1_KIBAR|nr:response regulator transcription factor [Kibdelosporangium aridum]SMD08870.1 DNA-binding response regulator, NarL/FixJ family, contains REC and HTH domains [Kibdelosporangium aridum]